MQTFRVILIEILMVILVEILMQILFSRESQWIGNANFACIRIRSLLIGVDRKLEFENYLFKLQFS